MQKNKFSSGFTLMETLLAMAIFLTVSVGLYNGFAKSLKLVNLIKMKEIATNLANEQFEIARNLPYASVGTVNGIPSGPFLQTQTVTRSGRDFTVDITIRNYDDPFDGTLGGAPNDLSPADFKLIDVTVTCSNCGSFAPITLTTKIAPKNLETASTNGALVVRVFDSSGNPVVNADVNIKNSTTNTNTPTVNINDVTGADGTLTIVDIPPAVNGYTITASKSGYSTETTYPLGGGSNPNPNKTDATIIIQQITQISFTIDQVSTIPVSSVTTQCAATPNFDFDITGTKLIGTNPDTIKYSGSFTTNGSGLVTLNNMEWDTYNVVGTDATYDIIGTNPLMSLGISPGATQNLQITTAAKNGRRLVVIIRDQATGLPVTDASVTLNGPSSYSQTKITDEGFITQTDWSLGSGQTDVGDSSMYLSDDGNISWSGTPGEINLAQSLGVYSSSGTLTSSTFDTGAASNFKQILWSPLPQPAQTGVDSVKFQIATNNDNLTWNYIGPDGTSSTYYTAANQNINTSHSGDRYLRYKVYLSTINPLFTPSISDVSVTYTSSCIPPGQVNFSGLATGSYTIDVVKSGYQSTSKSLTVSSNWQSQEVTISQ
jgi:prepilin-type N-terminal cleavage/methylation domain-containing protein